jgi:lambda family phage minor tail protein L
VTIRSDIQSLAPGAVVELFDLDVGGTMFRFHAGVNALGNDVVWQTNTYTRLPIQASGFEWRSSGTLPRPKVQIANANGLIGGLTRQNNDLVGSVLTRRRTFVRYLDAINFPGGANPSADPTAALPSEVYFVARRAAENPAVIEFELAAALDVAGVRLPRRQVVQNVCTWLYRGTECGYAGDPVAMANDQATSDPLLDKCGKRLSSCKLRFGEHGELPYGGFPAAGLLR